MAAASAWVLGPAVEVAAVATDAVTAVVPAAAPGSAEVAEVATGSGTAAVPAMGPGEVSAERVAGPAEAGVA